MMNRMEDEKVTELIIGYAMEVIPIEALAFLNRFTKMRLPTN